MNECERYWFRINKKHLIADCCVAAVFTIFDGGWLIAAIFYMIAVEVCGMNCLFALRFSDNDGDSLGIFKTLTVERRVFYNTYIKMMIFQSAVFAAVYALGTAFGSISGIEIPFLPRAFFANETLFSVIGYYAFIGSFLIGVLAVMSGLANGCSTVKRSMLFIGNIYCMIFYQILYLAFLTLAKLSPQPSFIHRIFAAAGCVTLCVMAAVFAVSVKKNRAKFVAK